MGALASIFFCRGRTNEMASFYFIYVAHLNMKMIGSVDVLDQYNIQARRQGVPTHPPRSQKGPPAGIVKELK